MGEPAGIGGVVAALSVTSDLARGQPAGEATRPSLLGTASPAGSRRGRSAPSREP